MDNKANLKKGIMTAFLATTVVILGVMVVAALPSFGTPSVNDTSFNEDSVIYLNFTVPLVNEAVYIVNISGPTGCTINNTNGTTNTNVTTGHTLTRTVSTWMSWSNATASALLNSTNAGNFTINASCTTPVSATNFTIELTNTSNVTYTNSTNVTVEIVDATAPTFTNWTTTNDTNYTNSATYVLNATLADVINVSKAWIRFDSNNTANYTATVTGTTTGIVNYTLNLTTLSWMTAGAHNYTVFANDTAGNEYSNATNVQWFTADYTAPGYAAIDYPTAGTWHIVDFLVNATSNDSATGLEYAQYSLSTNSTWVNMSLVSGDIWNASVDISDWADGNYTLLIRSYDYAGNVNTTATNITAIGIDDTNPAAGLTISDTTVNLGSTVVLTNTATDVTSNVATRTISVLTPLGNTDSVTLVNGVGTYTPSDGTGTYTVTSTAIDYASNSASTSSTMTISTSTTGGGGGGGGGASTPEPAATTSWAQMVPGTSYAKELNGDIGIELAITVKEEASNVKVEVTKLAAQPADTGALSGTAYKYFNFAMRNLEDTNVDTADITFDVENTWLAENNIDVATVVLNRYVGTEWVALETELVEEGETITSFKASAPGFSYFAITAEEIVGDTTPDTTEGVSYWWWIIGIVLVVGIGVALFYAVKKPQA